MVVQINFEKFLTKNTEEDIPLPHIFVVCWLKP